MIQQQFKKCAALAESACMLKFLDILRSIYRYDREKFSCDLGVCLDLSIRNCFLYDINVKLFIAIVTKFKIALSDGLVHSSRANYWS
jgi:hypothetical protein